MFQMRTSLPEYGNKFYNNGNNGGWSWCIDGYPTCEGRNVLANCVGYACGRFNEIIGSMKYPEFCCNAENFIEVAERLGLEISNTPSVGAIMVWQKGSLSSGDGAGHVAIVERVDSYNQVYTSESGWGGSAFWNSIRTNDNGRWGQNSSYSFRGFIKNPSSPEPTPSHKIVEDGLWGCDTTRKAQEIFGTPVDGIVSNQYSYWRNQNPGLLSSTFKWVDYISGGSLLIASIQRKVGVNPDGLIGYDTISGMQRWLGTPVDGCVSNPSTMVKAFQHWLNEQ